MDTTAADDVRSVLARAGVFLRPLEWNDERGDGYSLYSADTEFGRFVYGTDRNGVSYYQCDKETDVASETVARRGAEDAYEAAAWARIAPFLVVSGVRRGARAEGLASLLEEMRTKFVEYAAECEVASTYGGPTIHPANPFDEATARRFAAALAELSVKGDGRPA